MVLNATAKRGISRIIDRMICADNCQIGTIVHLERPTLIGRYCTAKAMRLATKTTQVSEGITSIKYFVQFLIDGDNWISSDSPNYDFSGADTNRIWNQVWYCNGDEI